MFGGLFGAPGGGFYEANYRAYPVAFIEKETAEKGDKVILPPSALDKLAQMHVEYPMLFRIENKRESRHSHCGVLEFVAQEGVCYMPHWMMQNLLLSEGDLVNLKNVSLPKGNFVKIQPHTSDFLDISNPKAVLETCLRGFTCMTQGDTFAIDYNGKKYFIDAVEVKPQGAASVVETDLNVDFAPPKDYKEPDYSAAAAAPADVDMASEPAAAPTQPEPEAEPEAPTFLAFGGTGNRLDGKAAGPSRPVAVAVPALGRSNVPPGTQPPAEKPAAKDGGSAPKSGKVVFGQAGLAASNRLAARLATSDGARKPAAPAKPEPEQDDKVKFQAFQGKGRSLKD